MHPGAGTQFFPYRAPRSKEKAGITESSPPDNPGLASEQKNSDRRQEMGIKEKRKEIMQTKNCERKRNRGHMCRTLMDRFSLLSPTLCFPLSPPHS